MQELRREIGSVVPYDGVEFGIDLECLELVQVIERGEHLTVQLVREVHEALGTVIEREMDDVLPFVSGLDNVQDYVTTPDSVEAIRRTAHPTPLRGKPPHLTSCLGDVLFRDISPQVRP